MILTYDEGLERSDNKEWFKSFFKREDLASDSKVKLINDLANEVGINFLNEYLEDDEDIALQDIYADDLIDFLQAVKRGDMDGGNS